jgi:hypothetical protein
MPANTVYDTGTEAPKIKRKRTIELDETSSQPAREQVLKKYGGAIKFTIFTFSFASILEKNLEIQIFFPAIFKKPSRRC